MMPPLPLGLDAEGIDLKQVWSEVVHELADRKFRGRSHHNRKTYEHGCLGPLCRKANRDYMRRRTTPNKKYQQLDPILVFFFEEARAQLAADEEAAPLRLTS